MAAAFSAWVVMVSSAIASKGHQVNVRRPNILWIMADDLGMGEPSHASAPFSTHGRISTPRVDKLASQGMRFSAAYAGYTVCAPSRATLMTGRNSGHLQGVPNGAPTLTQLLKSGGYDTAVFGKSAPMDECPPKGDCNEIQWGLPRVFGVDTFIGTPNQALCHNMYPVSITSENVSVPLPLNMANKSRNLCMSHPERYNYSSDLYTDASIAWLRKRAADDSNPFFLYVSYTVPHAGGWASAPDYEEQGQPVPYGYAYSNNTDWPVVERDHAAVITDLDTRVGALLDTLESQGLEDNTVVFFASDNGAHSECGHDVKFFDSTGGLRGFKRSYYEGGIRSPSLVKWPGVIQPGSISHTPWAFWDALPTMLEIGSIPLPKSALFDGRSIVRALRGEEMEPPEYMYWTWNGVTNLHQSRPLVKNSGYSVRVGNWKGVVKLCASNVSTPSLHDAMELYDLSSDPYETRDVVRENWQVAHGMKKMLSSKSLSCACFQC